MSATRPKRSAKSAPSSKPHYIMIGGFLGAGKTTAVGKLAKSLSDQGLRVGLITNDQGKNLVDTSWLRSQGFETEEIPGGCFCCRFNSLVEATMTLTAQGRPDVIIAEPVGSCTDLVATVAYPFRQLHGKNFTVAPVSVLLDPVRALRAFGLEKGGSFSEKVLYIYHKQIEEADLVVISKCDLLGADRLEVLCAAIQAKFPKKEILAVSARDHTNLASWFARIASERQAAGKAMPVDYTVYADGEALLGWLNCTVRLAAKKGINPAALLERLAEEVQARLRARKAEVAHLKMSLHPAGGGLGELAVVNLVRNDHVPEISLRLGHPITDGELIINLRAEAPPDVLGTVVREGLEATTRVFPGLRATLDHLEHFRPGKPTPTHRLLTAN